MQTPLGTERVRRAYQVARDALLSERTSAGHWVGELSTSALATATAVSALALVQKHTGTSHQPLVTRGLAWLAAHQNPDGGWGDTVRSISNISTSMLGRAAFYLAGAAGEYADCLQRAEAYLLEHCGKTPAEQAEAIRKRYGKDRTFAVPILTTCALAGLVSWDEVQPLPFELACFPQAWFRFFKLHVVSYALPALIAMGQAIYRHRPPRNPAAWIARRLAVRRSLRVLQAIQPSSGGFLEAVPLTSFVTLSLASIGQAGHPVAQQAVRFLSGAVRPDGSWPIDSNLSTWVTTLAMNALTVAGELHEVDRQMELASWLQRQQFQERHPYTGAAPGGWGWTDLPGSVPDADDTPGAILALAHLNLSDGSSSCSQAEGVDWLLELQNSDGGWPTFCRGWGHLPFDRSGPDLTAHAIRALLAARGEWLSNKDLEEIFDLWPLPIVKWAKRRLERAFKSGLSYLARTQRPDGSWLPLWFGNQFAPNDENPTYGTARVLAAYRDMDKMDTDPARRGIAWLQGAQNPDGGWGGAAGVPSSIEETALAVEVLLDGGPCAQPAVNKGVAWLVQQVEAGGLSHPTPIGFYFAKLWYFEKLYPIIFTVAALGRAVRKSAAPG